MPLIYSKDIFADGIASGNFDIGDWTYGAPILRDFGEGLRLVIGRYRSIAAV